MNGTILNASPQILAPLFRCTFAAKNTSLLFSLISNFKNEILHKTESYIKLQIMGSALDIVTLKSELLKNGLVAGLWMEEFSHYEAMVGNPLDPNCALGEIVAKYRTKRGLPVDISNFVEFQDKL
jgi:hypothetical protein